MKTKRILSVLLCVALVLTLMPAVAFAADVTLEVTHSTAGALSTEITAALGGNPASDYTKLKIYVGDAPLNGSSYYQTGDWWLLYNLSDTLPNVTSLELVYTSGEHTIPDDALRHHLPVVGPAWFQALTLTNSGGSLTRIGNGAFCYCEALAGTLVIPATVTGIGELAFWDNIWLTDR